MLLTAKIYLACRETAWDFTPTLRDFWIRSNDVDQELALAILKTLSVDERHSRWVLRGFIHSHRANREAAFRERVVSAIPSFAQHYRPWDNFELFLKAIGSSREALMEFDHSNKYAKRLMKVSSQLHQKMEVTDTFVLDFLGAISVQPPPPKKRGRKQGKKKQTAICLLPMLNLGGETGNDLKRSIAEYAGILVGPKYKLMRDASANLEY